MSTFIPSLYDQIAQKVRESGAQTLTLDLFDTILLHKSWPSALQDLQTATAWKASLPELFGQHSESTILAWRQYAYKELQSLHADDLLTEFQPDLETWFASIIDLMANFYQTPAQTQADLEQTADTQNADPETSHTQPFSDEQRTAYVKTMLQNELTVAKRHLTPNHPFIDALASLKQALPGLKIYFLEDGPYRTAELQELLDHFEIGIFDGGISSVDAAVTKRSGRLYQYIQNTDTLAENFSLKTNLHIGDNHLSDYNQATRAGSLALHYRPIRLRGLRTLAGRIKSLYLSFHDRHFPKVTALTPLHICHIASHHPETRFLIPDELISNFERLTLPANLQPTSKLSYNSVTGAMVWLLANRHDQTWNTRTIAYIISQYLNDNSRPAVYDFCFQNDFPRSDFLLNSRSDDDFRAALLYDLTTADAAFTAHLRQSYVDLADLLPLAQEGITIVETSSKKSPITTLFRDFAKLHGVNATIRNQKF